MLLRQHAELFRHDRASGARRIPESVPPHSPINVLFLVKHMNIGGGEYVIRTLIERLDRGEFRPVLCCLGDEGKFGRALREQGVPIYSRLARRNADIAALPRLLRCLRRERIDLLYVLNYPSAILWGGVAAWLHGIPSIVAIHSNALWELPGLNHRLGLKLLRAHDRLVTLGAYQKDYLTAREGISPERIEIIANGIDVARGRRTAGASPSRRAALGLGEGAFVIGTVAVLRPEKNISMLFDAVEVLIMRGTDARLVIVGDGSERPMLQQEAVARGLAERIAFLGYHDDPAVLLPSFDVFALTSRSEVMPISILEAMAGGIPVVATAVGAVSEMVVDGVTGFLVASGDGFALAERLFELAEAPALRRQMGGRGHERAQSAFALDRMVSRTEALLRATAADRRAVAL